ncbi:MAG: DUF2442 domain-containing protein [Pikeienuella sp.]|uniref:DUF2442 domain-containing protein n=1 Tax=Pikeienuella sp. TaxID=2831957 RepID=UPI003919B479
MSRLPKLLSVRAAAPGLLDIVWSDGEHRRVDVSELLRRHHLLEALNDPDLFRRVAIDEFGSGVAWPNGADFCADALRLRGDAQLSDYEKATA